MPGNVRHFRPSARSASRLAIALLSLVFACVILAFYPATASAEVSATLGGDSEAAAAANSLSTAGILTNWDTSAGVQQRYISRGELAILLARALGLKDSTTPHYSDVTSGQGCFGAVGALYEVGLLSSEPATTFSPSGLVSRRRAALWIMDSLGHKVSEQTGRPVPFRLSYFESADAWLVGFRDRPLIGAEFSRAVANAYRLGIVDATSDGWFYPTLPVSWGDAVIMIDQAFTKLLVPRADHPATLPETWSYPSLKVKSTGPLVWFVEYRLTSLKYYPGTIDGVYDNQTRDAMYAFQKVERIDRTGSVGDAVWQRLPGAVTPTPKMSDVGTRVEVDITRQVLFMITDNKVWKIVHVSTGRNGTRTGHFHIKEKYKGNVQCVTVNGVMYYPSYVVSKTAIHGYKSVPTYPASHGCIRVPMWMAEDLWYETPTGMTIDVYYNK
jgi:peptidoglycan hydrolase-like protein with peptidoglycan-binding domain